MFFTHFANFCSHDLLPQITCKTSPKLPIWALLSVKILALSQSQFQLTSWFCHCWCYWDGAGINWQVIHSPNANEWQAALDYKINQLEKLGTWVIEDLLKDKPIILCTEVLKVKPTEYMDSCQQVEDIHCLETFSAAVKILSVCVILANVKNEPYFLNLN